MTGTVWLSRDDMGTINPGDVIKSLRKGMTVMGIADHVTASGDWVTEQGGTLIRCIGHARFQIMDPPDNALMPDRGTMVAVRFEPHLTEHDIVFDGHEWVHCGDGEPVDITVPWASWRFIGGRLTRA